ncbi:protein translocase subunit SecD [Oceanicella actignis]|uniref:protein translocase subunit SecD n=1 Tax=Oceanicella actignis TaxID=1189325 RepID=UPI0011E7F640|nr:protein translocase subunit SecD [Oceanicella actignis]TYO89945.1 preprotein translocase subunit SecD [Oceanicella actignis]
MLYFPAWKKAVVILACLAGVLFSLPNLFYDRVERANDARKALEAGRTDPGLAEQAALWPAWLPSGLVNLGLDLRGGAHLLVEVELADVYAERMDALWPEARKTLREIRDLIGGFRRVDQGGPELRIRLNDPAGMPHAIKALEALATPVGGGLLGAGGPDIEVEAQGDEVVVRLTEAARRQIDESTMAQSLEIIRRRIDAAGTREPTIQRQGRDRILVQVPGVGSAEEVLALIGTTAKLTFHLVDSASADANTRPGPGKIKVPDADDPQRFYILEREALITGDRLTDAQPGFDQQTGQPVVNFRFDTAGARRFGQVTAANVGRPFAIVLDGKVITAPVIREPITGGAGQISGSFTVESATRLAILLRAGALPARIKVLEQRTVGPDLGADSIAAGERAVVVAFVAVLVFMVLAYGLFGVFADIALMFNLAMLIGALSALGATLTLPGIAGIVLTVGMAVDANVLIFERIREELRAGKGPARAIELGYERAFSAIVDANVTTLIAAVILFAMGSGPVKGFAVTLGIGILTSVFTAVLVTRLIISIWFAARRPRTLTV